MHYAVECKSEPKFISYFNSIAIKSTNVKRMEEDEERNETTKTIMNSSVSLFM